MSLKPLENSDNGMKKAQCKSCITNTPNNKRTVHKIHELIFGNSDSVDSDQKKTIDDSQSTLNSNDVFCYSWEPGNPPSVHHVELYRNSLEESFGFFLRRGTHIVRVCASEHGGYYEKKNDATFTEPCSDNICTGLLPGDKLLSIDGKDVAHLDSHDITSIIKNSLNIKLTVQPSYECSEFSERNLSLNFDDNNDIFENMDIIPVRELVTKRFGFKNLSLYIAKFFNNHSETLANQNQNFNQELSPNSSDRRMTDQFSSSGIEADQRSIGSIMFNSYDSKYERVWYSKRGECCSANLLSRKENGKCKIILRHNLNELDVEENDLERVSHSISWNCKTANPSNLDRIENLSRLRFINESSIVHTLSQRFGSQLIHTYAEGVGLIQINPMVPLNIYNELIMRLFLNCDKLEDMPPHVFSVGQLALSRLNQSSKCDKIQKIILMGRSGSGKSKSMEYILKYLVYATTINVELEKRKIHLKRIHSAIELLDAFTCSRTLVNTNASRCVRKYDFIVDKNMNYSSINIKTYLLEKCRVTRRPDIEPTFHIFYYFLAGLQNDVKKELMLTNLDEPNMFMTTLTRPQDREIAQKMWLNLCKAAEYLGIDSNKEFLTHGISRLLAIIYHLGYAGCKSEANLQTALDSGVCLFTNMVGAEMAARLFNCSVATLHSAIFNPNFINSSSNGNNSSNRVNGNYESFTPIVALEDFVNGLYQDVVNILISLINRSLSAKGDVGGRIVLVDPPGLQIPSSGGRISGASFEDLIFNYANERLLKLYKMTNYNLVKKRLDSEKFENSMTTEDSCYSSYDMASIIDSDERMSEGGSRLNTPTINTTAFYNQNFCQDFEGLKIASSNLRIINHAEVNLRTKDSQANCDDSISRSRTETHDVTELSMDLGNSRGEGCILSILDKAAKINNEKYLINGLSALYQKHKQYIPDKDMRLIRNVRKEGRFTLNHFNQTVSIKYNVNGWLQNCIQCPTSRNGLELLKKSAQESLRSLAKCIAQPAFAESSDSICLEVKEEMNEIMNILCDNCQLDENSTNDSIHWVHCLIPVANAGLCEVLDSPLSPNQMNLTQSLARFCGKLIRAQIRGLSIVSILRMNKLGFPIFLNFDEFNSRFRQFLGKNYQTDKNLCQRQIAEKILQNLCLPNNIYHLGPSMIFLKSSALTLIESRKGCIFDQNILVHLQAHCRRYLAKLDFSQKQRSLNNSTIKITETKLCNNSSSSMIISNNQIPKPVYLQNGNELRDEKEAKIICKYRLEENESVLRQLKDQLFDLNDTYKAEKAMNNHLSLQLEDSKDQINHLEHEVSRLRSRLVEMKTESLKMPLTVTNGNDSVSETNDEMMTSQMNQLKSIHLKEINSLKNELDETIADYDRKIQELKARLSEEESRNSEIHFSLVQTFDKQKDFDIAKKALEKQVDELTEERNQLRQHLSGVEKSAKMSQAELVSAKELYANELAKISDVKENLKVSTGKLVSIHGQLWLIGKQLVGALSNLTDQDLEIFREPAQVDELLMFCNRNLTNLFDQHSKEILSLKKDLTESEINMEKISDQLEDKRQIIQRMELTLEKLKHEANKANEDREIDHQNLRQQNNQRLKTLEEQLDETREERLKWQRERRILERQVEDLHNQVSSSRAIAEAASNNDSEINRKLKKEIQRLKMIISRNESLISMHYTEQTSSRQTTKELRDKLNEVEESKEVISRQNRLIQKELEESQQQILMTETLKKEVEQKHQQAIGEQNNLMSKLDDAEEKIEELTDQLRSLTMTRETERNRLEQLTEEIARLKEENSLLMNKYEELDKNNPIVEIIQPQVDLSEFQKLQAKIRDLESKLQLEDLSKNRLNNNLLRTKENLEVTRNERDSLLRNEQLEKEKNKKLQRLIKQNQEEVDILEKRLGEYETMKKESHQKFLSQKEEIDNLRFQLREANKKNSEISQNTSFIDNQDALRLYSSINYQEYVNSDEGNVSPVLSDLVQDCLVMEKIKPPKEPNSNGYICTMQN